MIIIGAGMAGLLAAGMLRNDVKGIWEAQASLPNNHSAVLRFRSSVVGDTLNIPFKKVDVMKAVEGDMNPVAAALAYSLKTNGTATLRSITSALGKVEERYIAPPDLVERMAHRLPVRVTYGTTFTKDVLDDYHMPFISTMPMPILMDALGWAKPEFNSVSGYNVIATLSNVDAYASIYIPDRVRAENRISLTGNKLTIEVACPKLTDDEVTRCVAQLESHPNMMRDTIEYAMKCFGLYPQDVDVLSWKVVKQRYAKILPIDESSRRDFIVWASEKHNVYSLGRFATWRPGLLLDDVVNDVRVIQNLIGGRGAYDHRKKAIQ